MPEEYRRNEPLLVSKIECNSYEGSRLADHWGHETKYRLLHRGNKSPSREQSIMFPVHFHQRDTTGIE